LYSFILTQTLLRLLGIRIPMHGDNRCCLVKVGLSYSHQEKHDSKKELAKRNKNSAKISPGNTSEHHTEPGRKKRLRRICKGNPSSAPSH